MWHIYLKWPTIITATQAKTIILSELTNRDQTKIKSEENNLILLSKSLNSMIIDSHIFDLNSSIYEFVDFLKINNWNGPIFLNYSLLFLVLITDNIRRVLAEKEEKR